MQLNSITKKLLEMLNSQNELNKTIIGEDYYNTHINYEDALIVEAGELLECTGYKWWKKSEVDIINAKLELVDIWHFMMSGILQTTGLKVLEDPELLGLVSHQFVPHKNYYEDDSVNFKELHRNLRLLIMSSVVLNSNNLDAYTYHFVKCMNSLAMDFNDLYQIYVIKNVLNRIRACNGYKSGDYYKLWYSIYDQKMHEDNKVVLMMMDHGVFNDMSPEDIFDYLDQYYHEHCDNQL